jgi:hypothetical protein
LLFGLRASPHFLQLWAHSSRYFSSSLEPTAEAAFWHIPLCSLQPSSLHRALMYLQMSCTSLGSNTARFVRTSRQSSRAITQVLTYLTRSRTSSRSFLRLISKGMFPYALCMNEGFDLKKLLYSQFTQAKSRQKHSSPKNLFLTGEGYRMLSL